MRRRRKRRQEEGSRKDEEEEEEWRRRSVATIVCRPFYFSTPHGRTVFSIESCGYYIKINLFHLPGDMIITGQTLSFLRTRAQNHFRPKGGCESLRPGRISPIPVNIVVA